MKGEGGGVGFEVLAQLLGLGFAVGGAGHQRAPVVLVHDHRQGRFGGGLESAHRKDQRLAFEGQQGRKGQALLFIQARDADRPFIAAEHEDFRFAIPIPVRDGQVADARQRGKGAWSGQRTIFLLEKYRDLSVFGISR